jgi:hypothetical protein
MMEPENFEVGTKPRLLKSLFVVQQALLERINLNNVNTSSVRPAPAGGRTEGCTTAGKLSDFEKPRS